MNNYSVVQTEDCCVLQRRFNNLREYFNCYMYNLDVNTVMPVNASKQANTCVTDSSNNGLSGEVRARV